jgi:hypothetical protein
MSFTINDYVFDCRSQSLCSMPCRSQSTNAQSGVVHAVPMPGTLVLAVTLQRQVISVVVKTVEGRGAYAGQVGGRLN